jgi:hypothetical protein
MVSRSDVACGRLRWMEVRELDVGEAGWRGADEMDELTGGGAGHEVDLSVGRCVGDVVVRNGVLDGARWCAGGWSLRSKKMAWWTEEKAGWARRELNGTGGTRRSSMSRNGRFDASPGGVSILRSPLVRDPLSFRLAPGRPAGPG